jgi:hypothetical protein
VLQLAEQDIVGYSRLNCFAAIDDGCVRRMRPAFEALRNARAEDHMTGTGENNQRAAWVCSEICCGALGHLTQFFDVGVL